MFVGQVERLKHMRERRVPAGDTLHGRFETEETLLLNGSGDFGTETAGQRSLVCDNDTAGLLDGLQKKI